MSNKIGGRIVRIKLKGFMTYDDLEIHPGKGLNLIIGLNGSGKSSIMSAICLGLGGKPQFTGRSGHVTDFIKFNHTKAMIEIELESSHGRSHVICRDIQEDKQLWYLNNKLTNYNEVASVIKKYNIDMGNLCQFLPQEKVAEFSKMDKKQRLVNMIQAIGDPSLVTLFNELKTLRNDFCRCEADLEERENTKISEQKLNERLEPEIAKHDEKMQLELELDILQFKKMVCQYKMCQVERSAKTAEMKQERRKVERMQETARELEVEKGRCSSELSEHLTKLNDLKTEVRKYMENLTKYYGNFGKCHEEIDNAKINFENRMLEKQEQMAKLTALSGQIEGLKEHLKMKESDMAELKESLRENVNKYEDVKRELYRCDSALEQVNLNKNALEYKKKSKTDERNRIANEENRRFEILRQKYPDTYKAVMWLEKNKSSFRKTIWPPPLVSIKVPRNENRKFIENHIQIRDLLMFVCEDEGDLERFVQAMKHEQKLSINVGMVPDATLDDFQSHPITNSMRNLGIVCYLKDLFTAPESVMRYVCQLNRVHKVPVCNIKAEENIDAILNYNSVFFTPSERIAGWRSKYGQQSMSVKRDSLMSRNVLPDVQDNSEALLSAERQLQEIEQALIEIKPQCDALEKQRIQFERQQEQLRIEKNNINIRIGKLNSLSMKLAQLTDSYDRKSKEVIDEKEEKKEVTDTIRGVNAKKLKILTEIQKIVKQILLHKKEKVTTILKMRGFGEKISSLDIKIRFNQGQLQEAKSHLAVVEAERNRLLQEGRKQFEDLKAKKESSSNAEHYEEFPDIRTWDAHFTNFYEGLEQLKEHRTSRISSQEFNLEEIEQRISNVEAQIELTDGDIVPILAEFKKRQETIDKIVDYVNSLKAKIEDLKTRIKEKKENWLPKLITHIESVNKKFSKYYKMLKCAGEISLDQTDDTDDFPNYGLQIKLKYRVNEEFMELSQTHHSGGECSVAAIIFILSLQELTDVPFRCIDEINQGMDAINERNMYQLVADAARSGSCSQYFLLTPKLLMDLSYHKDVAVHTIFNSPFLQTKLNVKEHLRIAKSNKC